MLTELSCKNASSFFTVSCIASPCKFDFLKPFKNFQIPFKWALKAFKGL
jgi:hypothetical protein